MNALRSYCRAVGFAGPVLHPKCTQNPCHQGARFGSAVAAEPRRASMPTCWLQNGFPALAIQRFPPVSRRSVPQLSHETGWRGGNVPGSRRRCCQAFVRRGGLLAEPEAEPAAHPGGIASWAGKANSGTASLAQPIIVLEPRCRISDGPDVTTLANRATTSTLGHAFFELASACLVFDSFQPCSHFRHRYRVSTASSWPSFAAMFFRPRKT